MDGQELPTLKQPTPPPAAETPPPRRGAMARMAAVGLAAGLAGGGVVYAAVRAGGDGSSTTTVTAPAATAATTAEDPATTAPAGAGRSTATGWTAVVRRTSPGVVSITSVLGGPQSALGGGGAASGTGFVIDAAGDIVTSQHVVSGATAITVRFQDGRSARARLVGSDASTDLAVIRVETSGVTLHPLTIGTAENVQVGDPVLAIGNPFGYDRSASAGIVSGLGREIQSPNGFTLTGAIQTDAAVNHGNSGGPLLDAAGRVVGVNAQIANSGVDANVGVAFSVPLDAANRRVIRELRTTGAVTHAWLGISGQTVDATLAQTGRVKASSGALVTGVVAGGPAAGAGLRPGSSPVTVAGASYCVGGDVITKVDGTAVGSMAALQSALAAVAPGTTVKLGVVRADGARATVAVRLAAQPATAPQVAGGC